MTKLVPCKMCFVRGVGVHEHELASFEMALRKGGIQACNLVMVSSILAPRCKIIGKKAGTAMLEPGQIVHCVMARQATNEPNRLIAASIGLAVPTDREIQYGYLSEHHSFGQTYKKAGDHAEDLAATMLATTLGVKFDANTAWKERENVYRQSGLIVQTRHITQSAESNKRGLWTTVFAAAVFCEYR